VTEYRQPHTVVKNAAVMQKIMEFRRDAAAMAAAAKIDASWQSQSHSNV